MNEHDRSGQWMIPVGAVVSVSIVFLITHAGIRWATPIFGSETGIFDAVVSALTLIALVAAGYGAFVSYGIGQQTLRLGVRRDLADRFTAGVEMLGSDKLAVTIAGMHVLKGVVTQDETYLIPAIHAFGAHAYAASKQQCELVLAGVEDGETARHTYEGPFPPGDFSAIEAVSYVATLLPVTGKWPDSNTFKHDHRLAIGRVYGRSSRFTGDIFVSMELTQWAVSNMSFENCTFRDCRLFLHAEGRLVFDNCTFEGTQLMILDFRGHIFGEPGFAADVRFPDCRASTSKMTGQELRFDQAR